MTYARPRMEKLADGVWAYIQPDGGWMVNNMGLIAGDDVVTSVDLTSTERRTREYLSAVWEATGRSPRRVVFTHAHPDHCNGAALLPDAEIVAHRSVADELQQPHRMAPHIFEPYDQGDTRPRVPTIVFDDAVAFDPAGLRVEVRHPGMRAHTRGDAYVWLPEQRVLFTGDLVFNGGTPFALSGSPAGWLRALEQLAALEPVTVVPGHGDVGGPELFEPVAAYLRFLMAAAEGAHAQGLTPLEAARGLDLGEFGGLIEQERIVGNLHRAMAELDGREVDFPAAWQDMYEYNGRALSCHA